jgi:hypothetical protein
MKKEIKHVNVLALEIGQYVYLEHKGKERLERVMSVETGYSDLHKRECAILVTAYSVDKIRREVGLNTPMSVASVISW